MDTARTVEDDHVALMNELIGEGVQFAMGCYTDVVGRCKPRSFRSENCPGCWPDRNGTPRGGSAAWA